MDGNGLSIGLPLVFPRNIEEEAGLLQGEENAPIYGKEVLECDYFQDPWYGRGVGEIDKGVASVKGYIVEKLKPGEEDKALESGCGQ
ncbi:hypothetical protein IFM89_036218 [Coptis chinensis]|uniref:LTI65/LTI78 PGEED repeat domain-containing protein n=1 Tax=Coptis chinensis TaxID=261450 RepID=A0A835LDM0_9MAGN|nr:hypothetical protein IFM89_036218 [Coptis chinensis]